MFRATFKTKYGESVRSNDPRISAYRHVYWVYRSTKESNHRSTHHPDGCITVVIPGVETITFVPEELNVDVK